jgi:hypothetical protein
MDAWYIQQNNSRKFPKSQERIAHLGTGSLRTPSYRAKI